MGVAGEEETFSNAKCQTFHDFFSGLFFCLLGKMLQNGMIDAFSVIDGETWTWHQRRPCTIPPPRPDLQMGRKRRRC